MACQKKIAMDAYDELLGGLDRAEELQLETLEKILREQQNTLFGRTHGFSQIKSPEDYRSRVPLSEYGDYADAIRRMLNGEDDLIMSGKPFAYLLSSGSSGRPKLIPISEEETRLHASVNNCIPEIARRYYERLGDDPDGVFGKTFHIDENIITHSPGGCLTTVTTSVPYYRTKTRGLLDFEQYTAPEEVLFPDDFTNLTYVKLRFALQERDVRRIVSVYARRLVSIFRFFEANRETILRDIELGTVDDSWELPEKWRTLVESRLPADPERARELRSISKPLRLKDIWPGLRYVVGIDGDTFPQIHTSLAALCEGVPFHNYIYGSSESFMAIATGM
ncbi:MAG: GH3 auxin-responsive promoter family protein, partial [Oscillospiraceae bacterium]|nr:GH3 auxin-responsive promoter family protein [Oscillospiraceae bacterium]